MLLLGYIIYNSNKALNEDLSKLSESLDITLKQEFLEYRTIMSMVSHDLILLGDTNIEKSFIKITKKYDLESLYNKNNMLKLDNVGIITTDDKLVTKFGIKKHNDKILKKLENKKYSNKLHFIAHQIDHEYQKNKIILAIELRNQDNQYKGYIKADWRC
jgi:hypothetical protein